MRTSVPEEDTPQVDASHAQLLVLIEQALAEADRVGHGEAGIHLDMAANALKRPS